MKVLQLGKFYPVGGGVEKVMFDLCSGLSGRGIRCDMLCAKAAPDAPDVVPLGENGRVLTVGTWAKAAGTMLAPAMPFRLRRLLREERYDVVHVHHPDPMAALSLWLSGWKGKVVLHWHSDILSQKALLALYKPLQNWLIRRADLILGTTPVYLEQSPHLKGARERGQRSASMPIGIRPVVSTGSDPVLARRVAALRDSLGGRNIIFSLGRLVPYKGFSDLVKAAAMLPDDCVVVIGGGGPLEAQLRAEVNNLGLTDKVKLLSRVPDEDIPLWFNACDLFCMSSVWKTEAFGIVQIEAMSVGRPVVATKIPESGVSWVNKEGVSGLNAEPGNPESLAACIMAVLADRERFGRGAAELFDERYTFDRMLDSCLAFYNSLL